MALVPLIREFNLTKKEDTMAVKKSVKKGAKECEEGRFL